MSYKQQVFEDGQILSADDLNIMSQGITEAAKDTMPLFNRFPTDEELLALPNHSYFMVGSTHWETEQPLKIYYILDKDWRTGVVHTITKKDGEIRRILSGDSNYGEIELGHYGLIPNNPDAAAHNSQIMDNLTMGDNAAEYGAILKLPLGLYYFNKPIDLSQRSLSLIGVNSRWTHLQNAGQTGIQSYTSRLGTSGLRFVTDDWEENTPALTTQQGIIRYINIYGDPNTYKVIVNRDALLDEDWQSNDIISEHYTHRFIAIYAKGGSFLDWICINNFYDGIKADGGNSFFTNIRCNLCHYGITTGHDNKLINIHGVDIMTLLNIKGSLNSAINIRADSCGAHLVEINDGGRGCGLFELDGDFVMGSLIHINHNVNNLFVDNARGRHSVLNCYIDNFTKDNITQIEHCGLISINNGYTLTNSIINTSQIPNSNPLDQDSNIKLPYILLSADENTIIQNVEFNTTNSELTTDIIYCQSQLNDNCEIKITTPLAEGKYYNSQGIEYIQTLGPYIATINNLPPNHLGNSLIIENKIYPQIDIDQINTLQSVTDAQKIYNVNGYLWACNRYMANSNIFVNRLRQGPNQINRIPTQLTDKFNIWTDSEVQQGYKTNSLISNKGEVFLDPNNSDIAFNAGEGYHTLLIALPYIPTTEQPLDIYINNIPWRGGPYTIDWIPLIVFSNGSYTNHTDIDIKLSYLNERWGELNGEFTVNAPTLTEPWNSKTSTMSYTDLIQELQKSENTNFTISNLHLHLTSDYFTNYGWIDTSTTGPAAYLQINGIASQYCTQSTLEKTAAGLVVTFNEPIEYSTETKNVWQNTGIPALGNKTVELDTRIQTLENKNTFDNPYVSFYMESPSRTVWSLSVTDQGALAIYEA